MTEFVRRTRFLTKYPELYTNTYWAGNSYYDDGSHLEKEILMCKNRDLIAERFKLKKHLGNSWCKTNEQYGHYFKVLDTTCTTEKDLRDHIEYYKTHDNNIVCIFSNYHCREVEHTIFSNHGYNLIEPVYGSDCSSYIKMINPKKGAILI